MIKLPNNYAFSYHVITGTEKLKTVLYSPDGKPLCGKSFSLKNKNFDDVLHDSERYYTRKIKNYLRNQK